MVSTYTTNIGLEKPSAGSYTSSWANVANTQYDLIDNAIAGICSVDVTGASDVTLTDSDGSADQSRMSTIVIKGTPSVQLSLLIPNNQTKQYAVRSKVLNTNNVIVNNVAKTGAGCTVANGEAFAMYTDGVRCRKLGVVPKNTIMFWSGTSTTIPAGWRHNGFLTGFLNMGPGPATAIGAVNPTVTVVSAGSHSHTGATGSTALTVDQIPGHEHTYQAPGPSQSVASGSGETTYEVGASTVATSLTGGSLGHTHTISTDGTHTHTVIVSGGEPAGWTLIPIQKYT